MGRAHQGPTIQRSVDPNPPVLRAASSSSEPPRGTPRPHHQALETQSVPSALLNPAPADGSAPVPTVSPLAVSAIPLDAVPARHPAATPGAAPDAAGISTSGGVAMPWARQAVVVPVVRAPSHGAGRSPDTSHAVQRAAAPVVVSGRTEHAIDIMSDQLPGPPRSPSVPGHTAPRSRLVLLPPVRSVTPRQDLPATGAREGPVAAPQPMSLQRIFEHAIRSAPETGPVHRDAHIADDESGSTTVTFGPAAVQRDTSMPGGPPGGDPPSTLAAPQVMGLPTPCRPAAAEVPPLDPAELVDTIYDTLAARLRAELWLDRERAGTLMDLPR